MVNCAKCNKKIGFFEYKYDYTDGDGTPIKYCSKCDNEWEKTQEKKEEAKKKLEEKQLKKIDDLLESNILLELFQRGYQEIKIISIKRNHTQVVIKIKLNFERHGYDNRYTYENKMSQKTDDFREYLGELIRDIHDTKFFEKNYTLLKFIFIGDEKDEHGNITQIEYATLKIKLHLFKKIKFNNLSNYELLELFEEVYEDFKFNYDFPNGLD